MRRFPYYTQAYLDATEAMEPNKRATLWWVVRLIYNTNVSVEDRVQDLNEATKEGIVFG